MWSGSNKLSLAEHSNMEFQKCAFYGSCPRTRGPLKSKNRHGAPQEAPKPDPTNLKSPASLPSSVIESIISPWLLLAYLLLGGAGGRDPHSGPIEAPMTHTVAPSFSSRLLCIPIYPQFVSMSFSALFSVLCSMII